MSKPISHLVWLGAGSAAEPANLFDKAEKITLIEARESACLQLQQKYNEPHFQIKQHLIGATESNLLFTEYNLAEFSAASQISGLKNLFPGIQKVREEKVTSVAITDALKALELTGDNNTLIIDIPDLSIELLSVLEQQDQLHLFNNIQVASSLEPLYAGAITSAEISAFLSAAGYALQQTISNDPELPWLNFNRNPLWTTLQITQKELLASKQQLIAQQQENEILNKALEESQINSTQKIQQLEEELKGAQIALINCQKITEETKYDLQKKLAVAQSELSASKQEITTLSQEREKFSKDLEKIRLESKQKIQQLEQQLSAAQQALITNQKATEQTQSETQKNIAAVKADAEKQVSVIKAVLETTKSELTKKQNENEELGRSIEAVKLNCDKKVQQMEQQLIDTKNAQSSNQDETKKLVADAEKKLAAAKTELEANKQEIHKLEARTNELNTALSAANKAKQDTEQQLATTKQQLSAAQQETAKIQQELAQVKSQLQQVTNEHGLQQSLEQKIQKMFADQAQQLSKEVGNIKNHINNGLGNTAKQLESFMGIQNYLERGVKPLSFHGWPISPDIGLYIAGLIDTNNYDVIIEFGSGTSTVLMAKALISKQRGVQTKALANTSQSNEVAVQDQTFTDLPARIVTFEHNSLYHGKTTQALKDNGVEHLVDLVHAPLVDYQYKDGSQYLYYNCNEKLQELAKIFKGRKANILVLVDGPPGSTNKNARFPALPHLLNHLPEHSFTILMDDYNRAEEKEIIGHWEKICESRFTQYKTTEIPCEKGLAVIKLI